MKNFYSSFLRKVLLNGMAFFCFYAFSGSAISQITIDPGIVPVAGTTFYAAKDTNVVYTGTSGANQQWDFSGWANHVVEVTQFADPSTLSGNSFFTASNLGLIQNGTNIFLKNSSSALEILGAYGDFGGGFMPLVFTPSQQFLSFPGTYQSSFSGTTKYVMTIPYQQPPIDSVRVVSEIVFSSLMDGWGAISTPAYAGLNSLRQQYTEIHTDSIFVRYSGVWMYSGQPPGVDTVVYYRWWSDSLDFMVAEIQTNGTGAVINSSYQIPPPPPVDVSFYGTPVSGCAPLTVDFTNTSSGAVYYQWDFGDGSTHFGFDTVHTYTAGGNYWVSLYAFDGNYNFLGSSNSVIFVGGSAGYFEMASDSVCPGDPVFFQGQDGAMDYSWNFGDGGFASGEQWVDHTYSVPGTYSVSLVVTTSCGVDTIVQSIFVGSGVTPGNGFSMWPSVVCPNQPVNLYSNAVGNSYQWNFGDGSSGNGQFTTHSYSNLGTFTITCIVGNSCGNSSTGTANIQVVSNVPFGQDLGIFNWPPSACPETEIYFSGPSDMAYYIWDFGDGTPADTLWTNELMHSFSATGIYNVSLTILNYCGNDTTLYSTVSIENNLPFNGWFDMNINPSPACPGSPVVFDAWSNEAVSFSWDFGDGSSSPFSAASHTYQNAGIYNASLTMVNSCGSDTVVYVDVDINNSVLPDPDDYQYGVLTDTACSGDSVVFFISPAGSGTYMWNFGDGTSSGTTYLYTDGAFSVDLAPHVFSSNGTFQVTFTLTNHCGNSFSDVFYVTIGGNVPVDGELWLNGSNSCQGDTVKFSATGGATYLWNFGDGSAPVTTMGTITDAFHSYVYAGEYPVSVLITNSCGNSETYFDTITIDSCSVGIQAANETGSQFIVFPNPGDGRFSVRILDPSLFTGTPETGNVGELKVFNSIGEKILCTPIKDRNSLVDISGQPGGMYFLQIVAGGNISYQKLIVE